MHCRYCRKNLTAAMAVYDLGKSKKSMMEIAPQSWCIKLEGKMDKYDFYDFEKVEAFINQRACKYMDYIRRWLAAKEKGNDKAKERALKMMRKHREQDEKFKMMAREARYYWW